jgi:hypothetical protein
MEINENIHTCSFDVTNMYTNVPQAELPEIIQHVLENSCISYDTFITETRTYYI